MTMHVRGAPVTPTTLLLIKLELPRPVFFLVANIPRVATPGQARALAGNLRAVSMARSSQLGKAVVFVGGVGMLQPARPGGGSEAQRTGSGELCGKPGREQLGQEQRHVQRLQAGEHLVCVKPDKGSVRT